MSLARNEAQVIKEPRKVLLVINSVEQELGHTSGGIEFNPDLSTYDIESDQVGVIDTIINTRSLKITTPILQWSPELLARVFPHAVYTVSGANAKVEIGTCRGKSLRSAAVQMILRPESKTASDKSEDITVFLAAPQGGQTITWNAEASKETLKVVWIAFPDSTKASDKNLFVIGDQTITA